VEQRGDNRHAKERDVKRWDIDCEGRIFHEGRFVAQIERTPENDGYDSSVAFRVMRVVVGSVGHGGESLLPPFTFESRVSGTSAQARIGTEAWRALTHERGGVVISDEQILDWLTETEGDDVPLKVTHRLCEAEGSVPTGRSWLRARRRVLALANTRSAEGENGG
jgi:hypothetical protein